MEVISNEFAASYAEALSEVRDRLYVCARNADADGDADAALAFLLGSLAVNKQAVAYDYMARGENLAHASATYFNRPQG